MYGVTDGLLLFVFPILVVFAAFAGTRLNSRLAGKVVIGIVALAASLAMTAIYHSGYSDFRSDKMTKPLRGDVIWSVHAPHSQPDRSADRARGSAFVGCAAQLRDRHVPPTAQVTVVAALALSPPRPPNGWRGGRPLTWSLLRPRLASPSRCARQWGLLAGE